jgi:hypothetical protein
MLCSLIHGTATLSGCVIENNPIVAAATLLFAYAEAAIPARLPGRNMTHTGEFYCRQKGGTNMRTSIRRTLLSLTVLLPAFATALDPGYIPPTAVFYHIDFDEPAPAEWGIDSGAWSVASGSYNSTSAAVAATSTIVEYFFNPFGPLEHGVLAPYTYRARVRNQGAGATSLAGVVFDYIDDANHNEALFSPTGTYVVREVRDGTSTVRASGNYLGAGQNVWFDVEVIREETTVLVRANGVGGTAVAIHQPAPGGNGRVGVTTRNTTARFDKVSIAKPWSMQQPFKEDFSSGLPSDWFTTGQWSVAGGTLNNTSVQQTSRASTIGPSITFGANSSLYFILRARMLNPYGGAGNLVGMYFNDDGSSRGEVLFSPRGVARIDLIRNGVAQTIATAAYPGRRNEWFDVRADISPGEITVAVNGITLFDNIDTSPIFEGNSGLLTHWAPGKFDDVWFDNRSTFAPLSVAFDSAPPADWTVSGTWNASGGTLNNVSAGVSDIVTTNCACWETDFSYRARLLNEYGASGNLVGLVYNYQRSRFTNGTKPYVGLYNGDYYEAVFAPTGQAFINKVLNGVRYRVASGTHSVPRNVWFDVEVLHQGTSTTVKVNGNTVFDRVPQGELPFGDVGVVSHWSKARFDNLTVTDAPLR